MDSTSVPQANRFPRGTEEPSLRGSGDPRGRSRVPGRDARWMTEYQHPQCARPRRDRLRATRGGWLGSRVFPSIQPRRPIAMPSQVSPTSALFDAGSSCDVPVCFDPQLPAAVSRRRGTSPRPKRQRDQPTETGSVSRFSGCAMKPMPSASCCVPRSALWYVLGRSLT